MHGSPSRTTSSLLRGWMLLLTVAAALGAALLPTSPAAAAESPPRAAYVWTQPQVKVLVRFAQSHDVNLLLVSVPPNLPTSSRVTWVRTLDRALVGTGITMHALGGDPGWIDDPGAALDWQADALSTRLFDGVHVDIEPWLNPGWTADQPATIAAYLDVLGLLAGASSVPLEADISFWLHEIATAHGTRLDVAVMQRVDAVTIMSYRDTVSGPDSITAVAAASLAAAENSGTPARLAVETRNLGDDPVSRKQTFYGATDAALNTALNQVAAYEAGVSVFVGMAVHDYFGWNALVG